MRDFGQVHTSFWESETLRGLDVEAQLLALYLLTCRHTHQAGAFRLPLAYASEDIGWDAERLAKGFATLSAAGWLCRCDQTGWVWIVKFSKYNKPQNPNQWKSVEKQLASIPANCSFLAQMEAVVEPLTNGSSKGSCNPSSPSPAPSPVLASKKSKAKEAVLDAWLAALDGADAVPAGDPIFDWASKQGISGDWLGYAWAAFEDRYAGKEKTYADWRAAFRDHVKRGWLDIWRTDARAGGFVLTTVGEQWRREVAA